MTTYTVASFYKFTPLDDYESYRSPILGAMKRHGILGSIILASEGINGCFAGTAEQLEAFYAALRAHKPFHDLQFSETTAATIPFEKAKVKLRAEIVTMGVNGVNPHESTGEHVSPEDWNELISDPDVVVIDTRNDYECEIGTFKHATNPHTDNFRDFPAYVQSELLDKKDKKIAMFCTGGVRCEKSTAYLQSLGFKQTYQLQGGIINYLRQMPKKDSLWQGECFVFDDRVTL